LILKTNLVSTILESKAKIIVTIGAGDIGELVPKIKQALL
jgi:UDP-N-acetylmuramate--alanine ligase